MAAPTSSGSPTRPAGVADTTAFAYRGSANTCFASGVLMYHGATALTRMPSGAHSHARYLVSMFMALLVMAYTTPLCMETSDATEELKTTAAARIGKPG